MMKPTSVCRHCQSQIEFSVSPVSYARCGFCLHDYAVYRNPSAGWFKILYLPVVDRAFLAAICLAILVALPRAGVSFYHLKMMAVLAALFGFQVYGVEAYYSLRSGVGRGGTIVSGDESARRRLLARLFFGVGFLMTPVPLFV